MKTEEEMQPPLPATPDSHTSVAGLFKDLSERSVAAEVSEIGLAEGLILLNAGSLPLTSWFPSAEPC